MHRAKINGFSVLCASKVIGSFFSPLFYFQARISKYATAGCSSDGNSTEWILGLGECVAIWINPWCVVHLLNWIVFISSHIYIFFLTFGVSMGSHDHFSEVKGGEKIVNGCK